mgnify:CR=1 FL=1
MGNRRMGGQRLQALMKRGAQGEDTSFQAGSGIKDAVVSHRLFKFGGLVETQILVDLQGKGDAAIFSADTDQDCIGATTVNTNETTALANAVEGCHLMKGENDTHGDFYEAEVIVVELPAGGTTDIDVVFETFAAGNKLGTAMASPTTLLVGQGNALVAGDRHIVPGFDTDLDTATPEVTPLAALTDVDGQGVYLTGADAAPGAQYTAGKLLIILRGYDTQWGF